MCVGGGGAHRGRSPRTKFSSTVSAMSSALWPVASLVAPTCSGQGQGRCALGPPRALPRSEGPNRRLRPHTHQRGAAIQRLAAEDTAEGAVGAGADLAHCGSIAGARVRQGKRGWWVTCR